MKSVTVLCPAKVNLTLDIVGKRPDGYHLMKMVMQSVSLYDRLELSLDGASAERKLRFSCEPPICGGPSANLAVRAARAFLSAADISEAGLFLHLSKQIPAAAGLGGGSGDAAGVLVGLNELYGVGFSLDKLCALGLPLGADVPFCLRGGTALVEGIGEKITPLSPLPDCSVLIAMPHTGSPTAAAFAAFDHAGGACFADSGAMRTALSAGSLPAVAAALCNVFEDVIMLPEVGELREKMLAGGALGARMTGSGSAVFGLFDHPAAAEKTAAAIRQAGWASFHCRPTRGGPEPEAAMPPGGAFTVRQAEEADSPALAELAGLLWPMHEKEELTHEMASGLCSPEAAFFLAEAEGVPLGFAQCALRRDYVEGTSHSPVGYLEGIFVRQEARRRGIAESLLQECERWAKGRGCAEFASDCELQNTQSLRFHLERGFAEANRIICFAKQL